MSEEQQKLEPLAMFAEADPPAPPVEGINAAIADAIASAERQRVADAAAPAVFMLTPAMLDAIRRARTIVSDSVVATIVTDSLARALVSGAVTPDAADQWTRERLAECEDSYRILSESK